MGTRVITAVLGIPFAIAVLLAGGLSLSITMLVLSIIGIYELYNVVKEQHKPIAIFGYITVILYYIFLHQIKDCFIVFLSITITILLTIMVIKYPRYSVVDITITLFGIFYTGVLFSLVVLTRESAEGLFWVWLIPISAWGSDTFAYFTGLTLGKHKLAPELSPKKTIEGSLGGVIGAGILGYVYILIYIAITKSAPEVPTIIVIVAVMLSAGWSQIGDLAASAIKRYFNQKDFGNLLPGHGGVLDRFDSLLFVAPIIYVAAIIAESII